MLFASVQCMWASRTLICPELQVLSQCLCRSSGFFPRTAFWHFFVILCVGDDRRKKKRRQSDKCTRQTSWWKYSTKSFFGGRLEMMWICVGFCPSFNVCMWNGNLSALGFTKLKLTIRSISLLVAQVEKTSDKITFEQTHFSFRQCLAKVDCHSVSSCFCRRHFVVVYIQFVWSVFFIIFILTRVQARMAKSWEILVSADKNKSWKYENKWKTRNHLSHLFCIVEFHNFCLLLCSSHRCICNFSTAKNLLLHEVAMMRLKKIRSGFQDKLMNAKSACQNIETENKSLPIKMLIRTKRSDVDNGEDKEIDRKSKKSQFIFFVGQKNLTIFSLSWN